MKRVSRWRVVRRKNQILEVLESGKWYTRRETCEELRLRSTVVTQAALDELVATQQINTAEAYYFLPREVSA